MVEFSCQFDDFYIANHLAFPVRTANFWRWFSQTESGYDLLNFLPTYGRVFWSL